MSGADGKNYWILWMSNVADITTNRINWRRRSNRFIRPSTTSVSTVRSCASSTMITLYLPKSWSVKASRSNIPSVKYSRRVKLDCRDWNRTRYPTYAPRLTSISYATRVATLMAAIRRGCVHAIMLGNILRYTANYIRKCGICVVLPLPVSPTRRVTGLCCTASWMRARYAYTGRCCRTRRNSSYRALYDRCVNGLILVELLLSLSLLLFAAFILWLLEMLWSFLSLQGLDDDSVYRSPSLPSDYTCSCICMPLLSISLCLSQFM